MPILEAKRLTLADVEVLTQAATLRQVDMENNLHMQAWANQAVQSTKKVGSSKYVSSYRSYRDFYDYDRAIEEAWHGGKNKDKNNNSKLYELIKKANARR